MVGASGDIYHRNDDVDVIIIVAIAYCRIDHMRDLVFNCRVTRKAIKTTDFVSNLFGMSLVVGSCCFTSTGITTSIFFIPHDQPVDDDP